jgi:hypothetical protein
MQFHGTTFGNLIILKPSNLCELLSRRVVWTFSFHVQGEFFFLTNKKLKKFFDHSCKVHVIYKDEFVQCHFVHANGVMHIFFGKWKSY